MKKLLFILIALIGFSTSIYAGTYATTFKSDSVGICYYMEYEDAYDQWWAVAWKNSDTVLIEGTDLLFNKQYTIEIVSRTYKSYIRSIAIWGKKHPNATHFPDRYVEKIMYFCKLVSCRKLSNLSNDY